MGRALPESSAFCDRMPEMLPAALCANTSTTFSARPPAGRANKQPVK
jgi:hypothetical protein